MNEIAPGIFHWTAFHQPISGRVSSYFIAPARVVIDPKRPEEDGWDALPERPEQVLLTSGHHVRDATDCAATFGIPIRASREAAQRIDGAIEVEVFGHHDEPAPGVIAIHIGKISEDEGAFHIAVGDGAIAFADGLIRYGGALGFVPDELIGDHPDRVKQGLKQAFSGLLERDFAHLLFAHGEPLVTKGKTELRQFIESPAGREDFGPVV
jgi:hypothetical protein